LPSHTAAPDNKLCAMPLQAGEEVCGSPCEVPESLLPFASQLFQCFPAVMLALGHPSLGKDFELPPAPSSCTLIEESGGYKLIQVVLRRRGASRKSAPPHAKTKQSQGHRAAARNGPARSSCDASVVAAALRSSPCSRDASAAAAVPRSSVSSSGTAAAPARCSLSSTGTSSTPQPRLRGMFCSAPAGREAVSATRKAHPAPVPAQPQLQPRAPTQAGASQPEGPPANGNLEPPLQPQACTCPEEEPAQSLEQPPPPLPPPPPQMEASAAHGAKQLQGGARSPRKRQGGKGGMSLGSLKEHGDEPQSPRSPGSYQPWEARRLT